MEENTEIKNLLLGSYEIPLVTEGYRITLYGYTSSDIEDVLFSKYYEDIPKIAIADTTYLVSRGHMTIDKDEEFVIFINRDRSTADMKDALVQSLFEAVTAVADILESEEYGARVMGDTFELFAPMLDPSLATAEKSPCRGMHVSDYAMPIYSEGDHVSLNMYDESMISEVHMVLRDSYMEKLLMGDLDPRSVHGFVTRPVLNELGVFVNNENEDTLLKQQKVIAHELFHAVTGIIRTFDDSTVLGARLYRALFRQFTDAISVLGHKND